MGRWKLVLIGLITILLVACTTTGREAGEEKNRDEGDSITEQDAGGKEEITTDEEDASDVERENGTNEEHIDEGIFLPEEYFNQLKEVDGKLVIQNVDNIFILVNKEMNLPADYVPGDLVRPKVRFVFGDQDVEKSYLRKEAAEALERMFEAAESEGIYLFASSGYRSYARQETIFQTKVEQVGEEKALEVVAYPGQSEHQTGLAMDITSQSNNFQLTESFAETPEGKWLAENAHRFGFILRYPKGKEAITGYSYEPWHFRYVGEMYAKIIYENDWTLEEFFQEARSL